MGINVDSISRPKGNLEAGGMNYEHDFTAQGMDMGISKYGSFIFYVAYCVAFIRCLLQFIFPWMVDVRRECK